MIALGETTLCARCGIVVRATLNPSSNLTVLRSDAGAKCSDGSANHDWTTVERMPKEIRTYRVVVEQALGVREFSTFTDDATVAFGVFTTFRLGTERTVRVECRNDANEHFSKISVSRSVIAISSGRKV